MFLLLACASAPLDCGYTDVFDGCEPPAGTECFLDAQAACVPAQVRDQEGNQYTVEDDCSVSVAECSGVDCAESVPCGEGDCGVVLDLGGPDIRLEPEGIAFGEVAVGDTSTVVVQIRNDGAEPLTVTDVRLPAFDVPLELGSLSSDVVPACQDVEFYVRFEPQVAEAFQASILVDSDDPDTAIAELSVTGTGI